MIRKITDISYRLGRQIVIAVIGGTLLLGGVIMLVTPGPGLALMLAGLAILAVEFAWARIWLRKLKDSVGPAGRDAAQKSWLRWRQRVFGARGSRSPVIPRLHESVFGAARGRRGVAVPRLKHLMYFL